MVEIKREHAVLHPVQSPKLDALPVGFWYLFWNNWSTSTAKLPKDLDNSNLVFQF